MRRGIGSAARICPRWSQAEGVRSKLKRLVQRGRLTENAPGVFALPPGDGDES